MISWRSLEVPAAGYLVKGTALAVGFVHGAGHRFGIYEIRTRGADGYPGLRYEVRDAEAGAKPVPVFHHPDDPGECEKWINEQK